MNHHSAHDVDAGIACELAPAAMLGSPGPGELFTTLYEQLRRLARREVRRTGASDDLSTVTVVHEAWLEIRDRPSLSFADPNQFLAYAARTMRGLVIDRVRAKQTQKRGGGLLVPLDTSSGEGPALPEHLESIAEALDHLAELDPALAQIVELKFFCGFTLAEIAGMRGVSARTVQRQWEKARVLLLGALS
jgi:RNA polymerase sigma factor (TIGR02999 family)